MTGELVSIYVDKKNGKEGKDFSDYKISNYGNIWSTKTNRYLRFNESTAYRTVCLYDKPTGEGCRVIVHRLVADKFVKGRTKKRGVVNHKDENKWNNCFRNLEWVTSQENTIYSIEYKKNKKLVNISGL